MSARLDQAGSAADQLAEAGRLQVSPPSRLRAWRERDLDVVRRLAALELADVRLSADTASA